MNRDHLIAQLQPRLEALAGELADLLLGELERRVDQVRAAFDAAVAVPAREPVRAQPKVLKSTPAKTKGRKPMTCSKCGAAGFTATTCGKTHNVPTSPAAAATQSRVRGEQRQPPATSTIKAPPPVSSADRRAALIAAAARRDAAKQQRAERSASFVRPRSGSTRRGAGAQRPDIDAQVLNDAPALPTPTASFDL